MTRILIILFAALSAASARAEWLEHVEDGIMGTRIVVELWSDDEAAGRAGGCR